MYRIIGLLSLILAVSCSRFGYMGTEEQSFPLVPQGSDSKLAQKLVPALLSLTGPEVLRTDECYQFSYVSRASNGLESGVNSDLLILLHPAEGFYADSDCLIPTDSVIIKKGFHDVAFYFRRSSAGTELIYGEAESFLVEARRINISEPSPSPFPSPSPSPSPSPAPSPSPQPTFTPPAAPPGAPGPGWHPFFL